MMMMMMMITVHFCVQMLDNCVEIWKHTDTMYIFMLLMAWRHGFSKHDDDIDRPAYNRSVTTIESSHVMYLYQSLGPLVSATMDLSSEVPDFRTSLN